MRAFITAPLDNERRASLWILVAARWVLLVAAIFLVNYDPDTSSSGQLALNALLAAAGVLNAFLHGSLLAGRRIPLWLPVLASVVDAAAITLAVALAGGIDQPVYVLYFPALLAFTLVFPRSWGLLYSAAVICAYVAVVVADENFDSGESGDLEALVLRVLALGATVLAANMAMRVERIRRAAAVSVEAMRGAEARLFERRALEAERAAREERLALARDVHDGLSQELYMLTLGLDTAGEAARRDDAEQLAGRLDALGRLSRQALLETRNLMFDLEGVMQGTRSVSALVRAQTDEFQAITGVEATVEVQGEERELPAALVSDLYRLLQESLANVYRHANATSVVVRLRFDQGFALDVEDDGCGFEAATVREGGRGLRNMRERAARAGGELAVCSVPGHGTNVAFRLAPLAPEAAK
jgi:signal transduction histidine kinase